MATCRHICRLSRQHVQTPGRIADFHGILQEIFGNHDFFVPFSLGEGKIHLGNKRKITFFFVFLSIFTTFAKTKQLNIKRR